MHCEQVQTQQHYKNLNDDPNQSRACTQTKDLWAEPTQRNVKIKLRVKSCIDIMMNMMNNSPLYVSGSESGGCDNLASGVCGHSPLKNKRGMGYSCVNRQNPLSGAIEMCLPYFEFGRLLV